MKNTNKIPTAVSPANNQKVGPVPIELDKSPKVFVTMKAKVQLVAPVIDPPIGLTSFENTSLTMTQGIGPKPIAKFRIWNFKQTKLLVPDSSKNSTYINGEGGQW